VVLLNQQHADGCTGIYEIVVEQIPDQRIGPCLGAKSSSDPNHYNSCRRSGASWILEGNDDARFFGAWPVDLVEIG
jgi:hypothetical protein